jgi:hypothetical protein
VVEFLVLLAPQPHVSGNREQQGGAGRGDPPQLTQRLALGGDVLEHVVAAIRSKLPSANGSRSRPARSTDSNPLSWQKRTASGEGSTPLASPIDA